MTTFAPTPLTTPSATLLPPLRLSPISLLGVGEEAPLRDLARFAEAEGTRLERTRDSASALRALAGGGWSAVLLALDEEPENQLAWWVEMMQRTARRPRLVPILPGPSIGFTLRAAQLGVFDVLPTPVERDRFSGLIRRVRAAEEEVPVPLPEVRPVSVGSAQMVSESPAMLPVFRAIAQVAPSTATVLVTGESGTGKELVARAIHLNGPRASGAFVPVNCAAIPENLLESELFGHEKGAFTGAVTRKIGRFERATGGTLFLDEIGDMSLPLQSKILRAVQEREIERVGGLKPIPIDVRVVAATHQNLDQLVVEGKFRQDLFYRLQGVRLLLPPLRERVDDLPDLITHLLDRAARRLGRAPALVSPEALRSLWTYAWPGNVRELQHVLEGAMVLSDGVILPSHLPPAIQRSAEAPTAQPMPTPGASLDEALEDWERRMILDALRQAGGVQARAAKVLGISERSLWYRVKKLNIQVRTPLS